MRFGHHFWNWDRAWDDDFDLRLKSTKESGWEGWEAKPAEIGAPPEAVREKCEALGISCAAIGGGIEEAIDYAEAVGASIVRAGVPRKECTRWVDKAAERGITIVVHSHVGSGGWRTTWEALGTCDRRYEIWGIDRQGTVRPGRQMQWPCGGSICRMRKRR